jgi:ATP-dependent RNA helicase SUPV3L1/SUV3
LADQLRALVGPAWARPGTASAAEAAAGCGTGSASLPSQELEAIIAASHTAFQVDDDGRLRFRGGRPLARLVRGPDLARPDVALLVADEVGAGARLRLSRRLLACARDLAPSLLGAMGELPRDANPVVRGLVYQIEQGLGTLSLEDAAAQLRDLSADDEGVLRRLGVERGRFCLYVPRLFAAEPLRLRAVLCRTFLAPGPRPPLPRPDELVLSVASDVPRRAYQALGFVVLDRLAVRADALEAVARRARSGWPPRELIRRLKCLPAQATALRSALLGAATRAADERTAEGAEDGLPSSRSGAHGPLPAG